jgi:hypothetical protein
MQSISVKSAGDVAEVDCGDEVGGSGDGYLSWKELGKHKQQT